MIEKILPAGVTNVKGVEGVKETAPKENVKEADNNTNFLKKTEGLSVSEMAEAIKDANAGKVNNVQENESVDYIKTKEEKLAEAKENLDEAKKKLEAAMKEYETRQKQLTSLREKMRNVQDPVKKARYNAAYDMLKAEFECAKANFRAAEGEVLKLQKKIELLEAEQTN